MLQKIFDTISNLTILSPDVWRQELVLLEKKSVCPDMPHACLGAVDAWGQHLAQVEEEGHGAL